jgi:uracil-DNA glycosylase family 4
MGRIFISYRRADSEGHVGRLYDHLCQNFRVEDLFMDVDDIKPGQDFVQVLEEAVGSCHVLLAVIGPHWANAVDERGERRLEQWNDFVRIEIATALKHSKMVIPILVQGARFPSADQLPEDLHSLARRNAIELTHKGFGYDVGRLVQVIQDYFLSMPRRGRPPRVPPEETLRRQRELDELRKVLEAQTDAPLYDFRRQNAYKVVLGDGDPASELMFVGEVPGETEAKSGRPFSGPSGEILDEMLELIGWDRDVVYITNIVPDLLSNKRKRPTQQELDFYTPYLAQQIEIVQPLMVVTLGGFAMEYMLKFFNVPVPGTITKIQGRMFNVQAPYGEIRLIPMIHPASIMYTPTKKDDLKEAFRKLGAAL